MQHWDRIRRESPDAATVQRMLTRTLSLLSEERRDNEKRDDHENERADAVERGRLLTLRENQHLVTGPGTW